MKKVCSIQCKKLGTAFDKRPGTVEPEFFLQTSKKALSEASKDLDSTDWTEQVSYLSKIRPVTEVTMEPVEFRKTLKSIFRDKGTINLLLDNDIKSYRILVSCQKCRDGEKYVITSGSFETH